MGRRVRGFTLLELLLAMTITSILVLGMHAAYRQAHSLWAQVEGQRRIYTQTRLLSETLRGELSSLYCPAAEDRLQSQDGDPSFQLLLGPDGAVELTFFTLTPVWQASPGSSRSARVRYRFTSDKGTGCGLLERFEEICAGGRVLGPETRTTLASDLAAFQCWAIDPNASRSDLKTNYESSERPPKALKVTIAWPASHEVPADSMEMLIPIPCDERLPPGPPT